MALLPSRIGYSQILFSRVRYSQALFSRVLSSQSLSSPIWIMTVYGAFVTVWTQDNTRNLDYMCLTVI